MFISKNFVTLSERNYASTQPRKSIVVQLFHLLVGVDITADRHPIDTGLVSAHRGRANSECKSSNQVISQHRVHDRLLFKFHVDLQLYDIYTIYIHIYMLYTIQIHAHNFIAWKHSIYQPFQKSRVSRPPLSVQRLLEAPEQ